MSPSQFHAKKEITPIVTKSNHNNNVNGMLPPHLKINRDSHFFKKPSSSPPSSSSSSSSTSSTMINSMAASNKPPQQHRHPVIIYTHSPRVIHTEPKDFMALVQKLTGLSRSDEKDDENNIVPSSQHQPLKQESVTSNVMVGDRDNDQKKVVILRNEDNDASSSVITDENIYGNNIGENRENQCFIASEAQMFEPPFNPYMTNYLASNSAEFLYSSPPLLNYSDSFFSHNMIASLPNSNTLEGMNEFGDYGL